jgi:transposase
LIKTLEEALESVKDLLCMSREAKDMFEGVQQQLLRRLLADAALQQRVERLSSIDGVGEITALTWAVWTSAGPGS